MVNKKTLIIVGIAVAGGIGYLAYRTYAKQQQGGGGAGGGGGGALVTDKTQYAQGEYIRWTASNLKIGQKYRVAIITGNIALYVPSRDEWVADSPTKSGLFLVGTNVPPGPALFVLDMIDGQAVRADQVPLTITGPAGGGGGGGGICLPPTCRPIVIL
jgi:hypothetical protein